MSDYDVVIIGGGPAGLSAGIYLSRGKNRTLLIDRDGFGGQIKNVEKIENYPGFTHGIGGAQLASEMVSQATNFGLQLDLAEVTNIELYSNSRCVLLEDGRSYTTKAIIIAGGCRRRKLGVQGESEFQGKGVFNCALCDGDEFADKAVAICGGGDSGITEAIYMANIASKVILLEMMPKISASPILQDKARSNPKIEIRCGIKVLSVLGNARVEALEVEDISTNKKSTLPLDGMLVDIGMEPNTDLLESIVSLDAGKRIRVKESMETESPFVFAAGDIRSGSMGQVVTAVSDGATAAIYIQRLLQQMP